MASVTNPPKAFLFDVFGTVCDWRGTVGRYFIERSKPNSPLSDQQWDDFTVAWHNIYLNFCISFVPGKSQWQTVDQMYREALDTLCVEWNIPDLWTAEEKDEITTIWHKLEPWRDSSAGLAALNRGGAQTSTLSNGNVALLKDLATRGRLPFTRIQSAEDFGAYKPSPKTYLGGAKALGFEPSECCFVAAHLDDLKMAHSLGYRAIYVARPREEGFDAVRVAKEKAEGWVELWVNHEDGGFLELARLMYGEEDV